MLAVLLAAGQSALAAPLHEVSPSELRRHVDRGHSRPLRGILDQVGKSVGGRALDVRAFADDQLYYRVVLMLPDGKLVSVVVNAETGQTMGRNSTTARAIGAQVSAGKSQGKATGGQTVAAASGTSVSASGRSAKGGAGNGNGGGQGNGNGGGNGNGNGGGNGGGKGKK